jgi:hypothetical protein
MMGAERALILLPDLKFSVTRICETIMLLAHSDMVKEHEFRTSLRYGLLKDMTVFGDQKKLKMLLLGEYPLLDRYKISLHDFVSSTTPKWGRQPTRAGRRLLIEALENLQIIMSVFFGDIYKSVCLPVLMALRSDVDLLQDYGDQFIQIKLDVAISRYMNEMQTAKKSLKFDEFVISSREDSFNLLQRFFFAEMKEATENQPVRWEQAPHTKFYAAEGFFSQLILIDPQKEMKKGDKAEKSEGKSDKQSDKKDKCRYHLAGALNLRDGKGNLWQCTSPHCRRRHTLPSAWPHAEATKILSRMGVTDDAIKKALPAPAGNCK